MFTGQRIAELAAPNALAQCGAGLIRNAGAAKKGMGRGLIQGDNDTYPLIRQGAKPFNGSVA